MTLTVASNSYIVHYYYYYYYYYYVAGCTIFHIFLRPFDNCIIFFLQLLLSFQSSSISPFSPISPLIPFAQVRSTPFSSSRWTPFHNFFWQSSYIYIVEFMKHPAKRCKANTVNVSAVSGKNTARSTLDEDRMTLLVVQLACWRMAVCHMCDDDLLPPNGPGWLRSRTAMNSSAQGSDRQSSALCQIPSKRPSIWWNAAENGLPQDGWRSVTRWSAERSGQGGRTNDATLLALTLNDDESSKNGIERPRRRFWSWTDGQRKSDWLRQTRHRQYMRQAVWSEHVAGRW